MNDPIVTVCGNLTRHPEERVTSNGKPLVKFRIAHTPRVQNKVTNEWEDRETLFLDVVCWRPTLVQNIAHSLERGNPVVVSGRLQSSSYETKEGEQRTSYEIDASIVAVDLNRVRARVIKVERDRGPAVPAGADPWAVTAGPLVSEVADLPAQSPEPVSPAA